MKYFVTGGAGFVGSNMVDKLLSLGHEVVAYDNGSTGVECFLKCAKTNPNFTLLWGDILDLTKLANAMCGCDFVFHFAANADIRDNLGHPDFVFEQNARGTFCVLEAMRMNGITRIAFSSTGSVYGEPTIFPTPEDAPFPIQTSLYAASKVYGESMISSYCEGYGFTGYIFRFVSLLGERYPHGHVFDFVRKLKSNPNNLQILGNGCQKKSYLYIEDCLEAILTAINRSGKNEKINIYNLGTDEYCEVKDSARWIAARMGIQPDFTFTGGERGWIGDSPFIYLDTQKIRSIGWRPKLTIQQSVERTVDYLLANPWLFEVRK